VGKVAKAERLAAFDAAFERLLEAVDRLPEAQLADKLETTSAREFLAQLIGWNHQVQEGCLSLQTGGTPAYYSDSDHDYARVNADSVRQFGPLDRKRMLDELSTSSRELTQYLSELEASDWNADRGVRHPEGGPATLRRELEVLTRRYLDAADEILLWLDSRGARER
jgi:hypothetical protein